MYEITRACQKGDLKKCSCKDQQERNTEQPSSNNQFKQNFEWAGCTDNVLFGHKLNFTLKSTTEKETIQSKKREEKGSS